MIFNIFVLGNSNVQVILKQIFFLISVQIWLDFKYRKALSKVSLT